MKQKCNQCEHIWLQRKNSEQKLCPNPHCHSPYWNEAKRKKRKDKKEV
jgi:hypothetical protein